MPEQEPNAGKIIAIILGASEWPNMPNLKPSDAFYKSAKGFRENLLDDLGLRLPQQFILDLFDRDLQTNEIDAAIRNFLKSNQSEGKPNFTDILFYYTGHGDFTSGDQYFQLILRSTHEDQRDYSGYQMRQLVRTMNEVARQSRKYIILDCCYAAAAFADWQMQGIDDVKVGIQREAEKVFPEISGTTLMCACNEDQWALYKDNDYTMFSGGMLTALETGSEKYEKSLGNRPMTALWG